MNLKKLLLSAAIVAFIPVSASAVVIQDVVIEDAAGANPYDVSGGVSVALATELDFAARNVDGDLEFDLEFGGNLTDDTHRITITLPAGIKFKEAATIADMTPDGTGVETEVRSTGGQVDDSSVVFLIDPNGADTNTVSFSFDVYAESCTGIAATNLAANVVLDASGTSVDGGDATITAGETPFTACKSAFKIAFAPDATDPKLTLGSGFTNFGTALVADDDDNFGTYETTVDGTAHEALNGDVVDGADLATVAFNVTVADASIFQDVNTGGQVDTFTANVAAVAGATGGNSGAVQFDFDLVDTTNAKSAQAAPTVAGVVFTTAGGKFPATVASTTTGTLSPLVREVTGETFEWTSSTGALSVFRVTQLTPSMPTIATVTLTNAHAVGGAAITGGPWTGSVTANAGGEAIIFSNALAGSFPGIPEFERGDITIEFEDLDADIDRLVIQNAEIFEFGNAAPD